MLRKAFVTLAIWCFVGQAMAASLPEDLVGVWATDNSTFKGHLLVEGEALYLGANGVGAIVGGTPTIRIKVLASFEQTTGTISFDVLQRETVVGHGAAVYNARNASVSFGDPTHPLFHRRFEEVSPETLKALGL